MIALVFLYLTASIFIYGADLNAAILKRREERKKQPDEQAAQATPAPGG
jgi:uncharacterized BrkB/YihY/UPF0761 family membrane protein